MTLAINTSLFGKLRQIISHQLGFEDQPGPNLVEIVEEPESLNLQSLIDVGYEIEPFLITPKNITSVNWIEKIHEPYFEPQIESIVNIKKACDKGQCKFNAKTENTGKNLDCVDIFKHPEDPDHYYGVFHEIHKE